MPKARKLDAATVQQAIASAQWLIKLRGGLSHKHSREYWRFSTKAELCGQVEGGERLVQGIKDVFAHGEVSISLLPGPRTWNEKLAAKLITDAMQGDADTAQVLHEVATDYLQRRVPLPNELADYVAAYLQQAISSKKQSHKKAQSHKTNYRDWILALTVDDVARHFNLKHTRNREPKEERDCGCSIVVRATKLSEKTVQNAWHRYHGVADQRTATNYVAQAMVTVTVSTGFSRLISSYPRILNDDGARRDFLVRFPRVGSIEAIPRQKPQRRSRSQRHETKKLIGKNRQLKGGATSH